MLEMVVPGQVILGEMASLHCLYDMEGEELYSVKWYKNGHEFFRYIPGILQIARIIKEERAIGIPLSHPDNNTSNSGEILNYLLSP